MLNLHMPVVAKNVEEQKFSEGERLSVLYHNVFDYPLSLAELIKWKCAAKLPAVNYWPSIVQKNNYFLVKGRETLVYQRLLRKRVSARKLKIGQRAAKILALIPTVKMVAVTGSLAMQNSTSESDVDLVIITKRNTLWLTRFFAYFLLSVARCKLRRSEAGCERDALCLNMWLDEDDLVFQKRNIYVAHEIAQIKPLVNKDKTYEKFLWQNRWILSYWPNAVKIQSPGSRVQSKNFLNTMYDMLTALLEPICFWLQYQYMKSKITREVVTPTRALFHPQDWGKLVLDKLNASFLK